MITIPRPQAEIIPLCERPAWKALRQHHAKIQNVHLRQIFALERAEFGTQARKLDFTLCERSLERGELAALGLKFPFFGPSDLEFRILKHGVAWFDR